MEKKFGQIMQMAFVVDDFDKAIEFWTKKMNVGPFLKIENVEFKELYYKEKATNLDFSGALSYTGNMQIELIKQYCDTPSIYTEYVNNEKGPLHHVCALTTDIKNDITVMESEGYKIIQGGKMQDDGQFVYLHSEDKKEPILELLEFSENWLSFFSSIENASKNWDRSTAIMKTEIKL